MLFQHRNPKKETLRAQQGAVAQEPVTEQVYSVRTPLALAGARARLGVQRGPPRGVSGQAAWSPWALASGGAGVREGPPQKPSRRGPHPHGHYGGGCSGPLLRPPARRPYLERRQRSRRPHAVASDKWGEEDAFSTLYFQAPNATSFERISAFSRFRNATSIYLCMYLLH